MTVDIFRQILEYFGIFMTSNIFVPFFCGGAVVVAGIRCIGHVIGGRFRV